MAAFLAMSDGVVKQPHLPKYHRRNPAMAQTASQIRNRWTFVIISPEDADISAIRHTSRSQPSLFLSQKY
jgi:hypothetical protein